MSAAVEDQGMLNATTLVSESSSSGMDEICEVEGEGEGEEEVVAVAVAVKWMGRRRRRRRRVGK